MKPVITVTEGITLVTFPNIPSDIASFASLCEKIASYGINIDMISVSPPQSALTSMSITIRDEDLLKALEFTSSLNDEAKNIKPVISSGNSKISVVDQEMEHAPGFAAKVFAAAATVNADLRIITTSEVQISMLVPSSDADNTFEAIQAAFA